MDHPEQWPLRDLVLRTPRLELRPDDDEGLRELVEIAYQGVHPPAEMPFAVPWTDADPRYLGRGMLQHFWSQRAQLAPERWSINFLTRVDGRVVGTQELAASDFGVVREVNTGSWLGMAHQGRGIGREMRAAVLMFAFDHLDARAARSGAFRDNPASLRVSERLGYVEDGTRALARRGEPVTEIRLLLPRAAFRRPEWTLEVAGAAAGLPLLGCHHPPAP